MGKQVHDESALLSLVYNAVLPWRSVDSIEMAEPETYDSQTDIDACCQCERRECINCLGGQAQGVKGRKRKYAHSNFADLFDNKKSMKEICELSGMSRATYFRYKKIHSKGGTT